MEGPLEKQIMVRMPADLLAAAQADARDNGRTLAQTVRFHLRAVLFNGADAGAPSATSANVGQERSGGTRDDEGAG